MGSVYILISVCDREILIETFKTHLHAQKQMHNEMVEWANLDPSIFSNAEFETDDFGFGEWSAWANGKHEYDWRICCIGGEDYDKSC